MCICDSIFWSLTHTTPDNTPASLAYQDEDCTSNPIQICTPSTSPAGCLTFSHVRNMASCREQNTTLQTKSAAMHSQRL